MDDCYNCIQIHAGSSPCLKIAQEDLLCSLKTYAQSSPPGEFRTEVYGGTIRRLPKFFHLESITRLEMGVEGHGREKWPPGDTKYIGELKDRIGIEMSRLASLLSELPNLEVFSWRDPNDMILTVGCFPITMLPEEPFSSFPEERKKLQIAFLGMRKLVELKFYNLFFDPSFFVIPPESTRKLVIGIEMSDDWWRQFAKCQMPSIRELEIDIVHPQSHLHPLSSDFTIEDVSVTGLEKVSVICGDEFIPSDLRECVAQRNEAYLPQYIREKARERAGEIMKENAEKLAEHAFYVSRALEAECVTKILAIPDHEDDRRKQEFAQEYASVFMNSFTGTIDLRSFTSARENARSLRAKTNEYFEEIIRRITQEMEDTYTIKFAHGVENNDKCEQEFRSQCQEKLNRWIEMENDASKYDLFNARNLTRELASISERELMSMQGLDMIELLERRNNINDTAIEGIATAIVTNSEEDIERITNEWAQERVQILEYLLCENTVFL
ncbi:hypothetical protein TWF970_004463 [Orbilia oligospora]|uniref:Uncharacterized protein n=1 Tax=Orbilia oligospora TaxID=2813651 RepID=A0A7C8RA60_ORBOL|nr:hypothetical protein TWF970_004463 [Orbilia oligospora]